MGAFDDLIPQQQAAPQGNAFSDLMPQGQPAERSLGEQAWREAQLFGRAAIAPFGGNGLADTMGMAQPETDSERVYGGITSGVVGNLGLTKLASTLAQGTSGATQAIMKLLADSPGLQSVLGGVSGGAEQLVKNAGGGQLAQTGAAIGAPVATMLGGKMLEPAVRRAGNIVTSMFDAGAPAAAGRVATDVAGDRAGAVAASVKNGMPTETAGQAAVPAGSAEFSGLEQLAKSRLPSDFNPAGTIPKNSAAWMKDQRDTLNRVADPLRSQFLAEADQTGLNVSPLSMEVARLRATPGFKDKTSNYILNWLDKELVRRADEGTGEIAGTDLYGLRKDLGTEIKKRAADVKKPWDKQMGVKLLSEFQKSIDHEIEMAAGNDNWTSQYMQPYAEQMAKLGGVTQRAADNEVMGAAGAARARKISNTDELPFSLPNLLSRPMMLLNAVLHRTQGYGGEKTTATIADLMKPENKARLGALMEQELARRQSRIPMLDALGKAGAAGTYQSMTPQ